MNIYRKLFFLIYNLILKTPSRDEFPYLLSIITLSGLLGFNIVLFFDAFISNSKLGEDGKGLFIFLYIFIGVLNFFYFRKDFKKNNKARIVFTFFRIYDFNLTNHISYYYNDFKKTRIYWLN